MESRSPSAADRLSPGQHRGDHRDRDDPVGELEQLEGLRVRRVAGPRGLGARPGGDVGGDQEAELGDAHVDEGPGAGADHLAQSGLTQVEPGPETEAHLVQRDHQHQALDHDPGGGAEPQEGEVGFAHRADVRARAARLQVVKDQDGDHHDVVQHRCPHRSGEPVAGVEDRPGERPDAEEGDLGKDELGQGDRDLDPPGAPVRGVEADQRPGEQHRDHGQQRQCDRAHGHQPLLVGPPAVDVALLPPHDHRHDDAAQDPADEEVEQDERDRVGDGVGVAHLRAAERGHEHRRADETRDAGDHRPRSHDRARTQDPAHAFSSARSLGAQDSVPAGALARLGGTVAAEARRVPLRRRTRMTTAASITSRAAPTITSAIPV